jgi:hypothetical protein
MSWVFTQNLRASAETIDHFSLGELGCPQAFDEVTTMQLSGVFSGGHHSIDGCETARNFFGDYAASGEYWIAV